jgi:hypothetical protein
MHGAEHLVNASLLTDRFGPQTSFHDAEVLHVELSRGQNVVVRMDLYMFAASEELDERGCFQRENASVVTFIFQGVHELTLVDFNEQNVLQDLAFSRREDSMLLVEIFSSYGLSGSFLCTEARVAQVQPHVERVGAEDSEQK